MRSAHYLHEGLRSSQTSLRRLLGPSTRRRCPSLFSSGLHSVEWLLLCLLLTAVSPALCLSTQVASCEAGSQPSPGIAQSLPHLSPPHLHHDSPGKYRTSTNMAVLSPSCCLVWGSCSSVQCFACAFLQTPPHGGRPWRSANASPCRVRGGLEPPSDCALPGDRVGGGVAPAVLPHHRTCGSASGG